MRFTWEDAQRILSLRVILLSGVWLDTFQAVIADIYQRRSCRPYAPSGSLNRKTAA